jgi:RNA polymerase sigma factor (sigma-70 family)
MDPSPHDTLPWDAEALNQWLSNANPEIRAIVSWRKWGFSDVERNEALQKIRLGLWRHAETHGKATDPGLLRNIAICRCIDVVRARTRERKRLVSMSLQSDGERSRQDLDVVETGAIGHDPLEWVDRMERARELGRLLRDLAPLCQEALQRFYLEEQSYQEIAQHLGLSINTVGSRLSKCLDKLRRLMRNTTLFQEEHPPRRRS